MSDEGKRANKMEKSQVTIVGLGQIGSSIGMAIKRKQSKEVEITGIDTDPEIAARARNRDAIDKISYNLQEAVSNASMVILAVPMNAMRDVMGLMAPALRDHAIVTDTGSTKAEILLWASEVLPNEVNFVGGHPMAGNEIPGIDGAEETLFDGATYCVIPSPTAHPDAVRGITELVEFVGATPYFIDADEHDGLVAAISHLPIAISITLMNMARNAQSWQEMAKLAAGSFRDVSRLASGDPEMHGGIFATNSQETVRWIDTYIEELTVLRDNIEKRDDAALSSTLKNAQTARKQWMSGKLESANDAVVEEMDENLKFSSQMEFMFLGSKAARIIRELRRPKKRK
ncbi:MAG: prephenate dehydrogenase/arogenate dehydrogenase family protein [SAR202 cluster bacterium]|nr:prephenate dehydrogenase/arogenate dehydrogenase family protein [SAR202 cluster bacterium]